MSVRTWSLYDTCGRCETRQIKTDGSASTWRTVTFHRRGSASDRLSTLLCPECSAALVAFLAPLISKREPSEEL